MAKLDQIDLAVPSLRLPAARPPFNPVPESIRRLAQTTVGQTEELGSILIRQHQQNQDHKALMEFYDRHGDLESTVENIKDPQEKLNVYNTGFNDILSGIHDQYPQLSDIANQQLARASSARRVGITGRILSQIDKQNHLDYKDNLALLVKQASEAKSDEERQEIEGIGVNAIKNAVANGFISETQGNLDTHKVIHAVAAAHMDELVAEHPQEALKVGQEESRLPWKEWSAKQTAARQKLDDNDKLLKKQVEMEKFKQKMDLYENPEKYRNDPQYTYTLLHQHKIDRNDYESVMGHKPTDPDLRAAIHDTLLNEPFKNQEELDTFVQNNFGDLEPSDRKFLMKDYKERSRKFNDEQSIHAEDLKANFRNQLAERLGPSLRDPNIKGQYRNLIHRLDKRLEHAKDVESQDKIIKEFNEQMDKDFPKFDPIFNLNGKQVPKTLVDAYQADESGIPVSTPTPKSEVQKTPNKNPTKHNFGQESFPGMIEKGNIDYETRPVISAPGGGHSSVSSISFEENGQEILIPTIDDEGNRLSPKEAIELYHKTGKHLGKFKDAESADAFAEKYHAQMGPSE